MKLLLFGGTFDPPHVGHMDILKNAIAAANPDKVMVVPAGIPPHKQGSTTPAGLRLAMCQCFCPLFTNTQISDMEIRREGKSYTWHTVQQLQTQYPGVKIYLCIGSDMLLSFTEWYNWRQLLQNVVLVVQNRRTQDIKNAMGAARILGRQGGKILFADWHVREVSSTQVRTAVRQGQSIAGLVPPLVAQIIQQNRLYMEDIPHES